MMEVMNYTLDEFQSKKDLALGTDSFPNVRIQSMPEDNGRPIASRSDNTVRSCLLDVRLRLGNKY